MKTISKFLLIAVVFFTTIGCSVYKYNKTFEGYNCDGLTYEGSNVYYNGELAAELGAIEVAYDDGKLVREATFVLTSSKYNEIAINIIKFVTEHKQSENWEVEVELKAQ